jgi:pimeloyl-ACP methyl ester carboxylesterase
MNDKRTWDTIRRSERLILTAGLLCDATIWNPVAERLGDPDPVTIRSFDGFSSITTMARALLADAPERFALAGHSMGARIALEVVRLAPERVTRLALLNTGVHPTRPDEAEKRGRLVALAREQGMAALADVWLPPMMGSGIDDAALMVELRAMVERQTPESFAGQIAALLDRPDAESVLASVAVPTLLIAATADQWSPIAQHEAMRALLPSAQLVVVQGAGHMAPVEAPDAVAIAFEEWLAA